MIELFKTEPTTDPELHQIEQRHTLDARWFDGGIHDPNSYVVMAHKDRGALLQRLRALRTGEGGSPGAVNPTDLSSLMDKWGNLRNPLTITIPKAAYDWLMGGGPDDRGQHFGDGIKIDHMGHTLGGKFWWRTTFRRMCGR